MPKKVTQVEIARVWGVNRSRITQYKSEGMPVASLELAFDWLALHYPDRAVKIKGIENQIIEKTKNNNPPPKEEKSEELSGGGISSVVARLIRSENVAWKMLDHAIKNNDIARVQALSKHHQSCAAARLSAEKELAEYRLKSNQVIPFSESIEMIARILAPIKSQLTALPFSSAARANPTDPELAREAITMEVEKMKTQIVDALEGLKNDS